MEVEIVLVVLAGILDWAAYQGTVPGVVQGCIEVAGEYHAVRATGPVAAKLRAVAPGAAVKVTGSWVTTRWKTQGGVAREGKYLKVESIE